MSYAFRSRDGLAQSNDADHIATWDAVQATAASKQREASARLMAMGVKMEHPDDGWVDRQKNSLWPCYPQFDLAPEVGDLIALGWPFSGYRIVRCTEIEHKTLLTHTVIYSFEETGEKVEAA